MHRTVTFTFLLLLGFITGPESHAASAKGEVIFLRGIFGVFSTGLNEMSDNLVKKGVSSSVYHHQNWRSAARYLVKQKSRGDAKTIVVVGHSFGADAAIRLSKYLNNKGVRIDYLITLDPTVEQSVPRNVSRTVNYYLPQSIWGKKVTVSSKDRRRLTNIQLATTDDFGHFSMDTDNQLKSVILSGIDDALKGKRPRIKRHRNTISRSSFSDDTFYNRSWALQRDAMDVILKMRIPGSFLE